MQRKTFSLREIANDAVLMSIERSMIRSLVNRLLLANGIDELPYTIRTGILRFRPRIPAEPDAVWIISKGVIEHKIAAGIWHH